MLVFWQSLDMMREAKSKKLLEPNARNHGLLESSQWDCDSISKSYFEAFPLDEMTAEFFLDTLSDVCDQKERSLKRWLSNASRKYVRVSLHRSRLLACQVYYLFGPRWGARSMMRWLFHSFLRGPHRHFTSVKGFLMNQKCRRSKAAAWTTNLGTWAQSWTPSSPWTIFSHDAYT